MSNTWENLAKKHIQNAALKVEKGKQLLAEFN